MQRAFLISQLLLVANIPTKALANIFLPWGDDAKSDRIIGGETVTSIGEEDRYPYSVSMQDGQGHFCGGSMIAADVVLTAAHCLGGDFSIVVGSDDVDQGQQIAVAQQIEHPLYDSNTDQYDMALLILEEPTTLDIPFVRVNDDNLYPPEGTTTHVMGWGDTDPGDGQRLSDILMIVDVEVISNNDCEDAEQGGDSYNGWIYPSMLCTSTKGQDACQGDSGGPLVVKNGSPDQDVIVGVVSWGVGCAFLPGVFGRVSRGYSWIEETVREESAACPNFPICVDTESPTKKPTPFPTRFPTKFPTRFPTKQPTNKPTRTPSKSPTENPTISPTTAEPTVSPTESPTDSPSISSAPTESPSASPTLTTEPTTAPSDSPTISTSPSASPSDSPTTSSQPSDSPTISTSPTSAPSGSPTLSSAPTNSAAPTSIPSAQPSSVPSSQPSEAPSSQPSSSSLPTISAEPTGTPTVPASLIKFDADGLLVPDIRDGLLMNEDGVQTASNSSPIRMSCSFAIGAVLTLIIL